MIDSARELLKKLPNGWVNSLLLLALIGLGLFANAERTLALTAIKDHDDHLAKIDTQIATLTANVDTLVKLEERRAQQSEARRQETLEMARQLQRAIDLVEVHVQATKKQPVQ